ncbi:hypothetical protein PDESU_02596 [Pontiella desulfatans]|uniref:LamG-like jellyroll fold domain-containing protein n=1 Tax=Pontiella desulfatans TaxID=2750659 RepID=A0A6C2U2M1_PONDE|nr:LamG domain-containing protein [Pontiella desulfatans]VGO14039.1 hypothetical protein PDESU_02596 [Pontiella desulfatans]
MKRWLYSIGLSVVSGMAAQGALVAEWNFDDETLNETLSGVTRRLSHRSGTTANTPAAYTNDTPTGSGFALDLSTDLDHCLVVTGNDGTGWAEPSNMTYAAWVKIDAWDAADNQWNTVFSKQTPSTGFRLTRIATQAGTGTDFIPAAGNIARDGAPVVDLTDGQWHHVAFTYDSSTSNLVYYIDGFAEASNPGAVYTPATTTHLTLGAWNTAGIRGANGLYDNIQIYDTALSAVEIAELVNPPDEGGEEVLFFDDFDAANGTSLYDPAGRATGTVAHLVKYGWVTDTNDVVVDGVLNWDANGDKDVLNEQPVANGQQLFRFASSTNSGHFSWFPYVGGKVWDLEYDILTGNSQPLNLGLSDITRNGTLKTYDDANYDFGVGNFGVGLRYDTDDDAGADSNHVANVFPDRATVYNIRVRFNEPLGKATIFVNGLEVAEAAGLDFEADNRYLTFGEGTKYAGFIDNLKISIPEITIEVEPFDAIPTVDLIANGGFTQITNETPSGTGGFNVIGSFGDFSAYWGRTAEVIGWSPYYDDPNNLRTRIGNVHSNDFGADILDGTFYLDTLIDADSSWVTLNSSMDYRNGLVQTDVLSGATINPAATYQFLVDAWQSNPGTDQSQATFTAALTTDFTNTASAVAGSLFSTTATNLPSAAGTLQTNVISGVDLLAAQGGGSVDVVFEQINTEAIVDYPNGTPNPMDPDQVSQVRIGEISLSVIVPEGDLNKDGILSPADVDLANTYLTGDGGDDAATRQQDLADIGIVGEDALIYLNLTEFDFDGNGYYDAADVAVLQSLLGDEDIVITGISSDAQGNIVVEASGLYAGKVYYLMRDASLTVAPVFDDVADSVLAGSGSATLTDTNAPSGSAFYRVTD